MMTDLFFGIFEKAWSSTYLMVRCSSKRCKKLFPKLMQRNPTKQCVLKWKFHQREQRKMQLILVFLLPLLNVCLIEMISECALHQIRRNGAFFPRHIDDHRQWVFPSVRTIDRQISRLNSLYVAMKIKNKITSDNESSIRVNPEFSFLFSIPFFPSYLADLENQFVDLEIHCSLIICRLIYFLSSSLSSKSIRKSHHQRQY